jgi:hypothetical protein
MPLITIKSNAQLDEEQRREQEIQTKAQTDAATEDRKATIAPRLNQYLEERWSKAKRVKVQVYNQMLKNLRQRRGKYEPDKLAAIKQMEGSEAWIMLSDTKCRAGESWVADVMLQPGEPPFSIEPTPVPDLPPAVEEQITGQFVDTIINKLVDGFTQIGQSPDMNVIKQIVHEKIPMFKQAIQQAMKQKAKENASQIKDILDDQLREGGWYKAFHDLLKDICDKKTCFLKGPVMRMEKVRKIVEDETGRPKVTYIDQAIPTWERRSQWTIYPSPESIGIQDSYLVDVITLTRRDLNSLLGIEGFIGTEIIEVLREHRQGSLQNWLMLDNEAEYLNALDLSTEFMYETEKIRCLEFWGSVTGAELIEYGMTKEEIPNVEMDYDVCVWKIGNHIIKAMINEDKMGKKPFYKVSYEDDQDTFWGKCVQELIVDTQAICNAIVRAIVNNVGVASGPQIELNVDRLEPGASRKIWPLRVWPVSEASMMSSAPAMKVNNITLNADKLMALYNHFSRIADEESGIPAYAHGDMDVGGAGNTSSGLANLMAASARGIKSVVKGLDDNIIAPSVESQYYWDLDNGKFDRMVCDMKIVATGTSNLIARGQQAVRIGELLDKTNNPVDLQIIGMEGRKDLLIQAAKANDIRLKGLNDSSIEQTITDIMNQLFAMPQFQAADPNAPGAGTLPPQQPGGMAPGGMAPMAGPGAAPPPGPMTLDSAGQAAQGEDNRLITHEQASASRGA